MHKSVLIPCGSFGMNGKSKTMILVVGTIGLLGVVLCIGGFFAVRHWGSAEKAAAEVRTEAKTAEAEGEEEKKVEVEEAKRVEPREKGFIVIEDLRDAAPWLKEEDSERYVFFFEKLLNLAEPGMKRGGGAESFDPAAILKAMGGPAKKEEQRFACFKNAVRLIVRGAFKGEEALDDRLDCVTALVRRGMFFVEGEVNDRNLLAFLKNDLKKAARQVEEVLYKAKQDLPLLAEGQQKLQQAAYGKKACWELIGNVMSVVTNLKPTKNTTNFRDEEDIHCLLTALAVARIRERQLLKMAALLAVTDAKAGEAKDLKAAFGYRFASTERLSSSLQIENRLKCSYPITDLPRTLLEYTPPILPGAIDAATVLGQTIHAVVSALESGVREAAAPGSKELIEKLHMMVATYADASEHAEDVLFQPPMTLAYLAVLDEEIVDLLEEFYLSRALISA